MIAMRMVQMTIDDVVRVIAMRERRVPAIGAMHMRCIVTRALMIRRAVDRVLRADIERVLLDRAVLAGVVKVAVMRVVDMVAVLHRRVAAAWPVLMRVALVMIVLSHVRLLRCHGVHADAWRARARS